MGKPIMKVWDSAQQKYVSVPAVKGSKGDKGDPGVPGKDGSDATVTAANIAGALGYTPAAPGDIPVVPAVLPNPNALTVKIGSTTVTYDGSSAQTVEIADGSEVSY